MNAIPTNQDLIQLLSEHPKAGIRFVLPEETLVPAHFHVTEVGRVQKDFIDCGGTVRSSAHCQLQLLVAKDVDHRLKAEKLKRILDLSAPLFGEDDLPLVVEHEDGRTIAFPVTSIDLVREDVEIRLALPHPACLAADKCGLTFEEAGVGNLVFSPVATEEGCCSAGSGCC